MNHQTTISADGRRILELEIENARLQKLVAELLIKNQELREGVGRSTPTERGARARRSGLHLDPAIYNVQQEQGS